MWDLAKKEPLSPFSRNVCSNLGSGWRLTAKLFMGQSLGIFRGISTLKVTLFGTLQVIVFLKKKSCKNRKGKSPFDFRK